MNRTAIRAICFLGSILLSRPMIAGAIEYENCAPTKNDYAEKKLDPSSVFDCITDYKVIPTRFSELTKASNEALMPSACIYQSMKYTSEAFNNSVTAKAPLFHFNMCWYKAGEGTLTPELIYKNQNGDPLPAPCVSEKLHFMTYLSLIEVMNCIELDPKDIFALLNWESGFFYNIGHNKDYGLGIGQITEFAVKHVNGKDEKTSLLTSLKKSSKCTSLKELLKTGLDEKKVCEWVEAPHSITKGLLYAGLTFKTHLGLAHSILSKTPALKSLSPIEKKTVARQLAQYMYNAGAQPIEAAVSDFSKLHATCTLAQFKSDFPKSITNAYKAMQDQAEVELKSVKEKNPIDKSKVQSLESNIQYLKTKGPIVNKYVSQIETKLLTVQSRVEKNTKCAN